MKSLKIQSRRTFGEPHGTFQLRKDRRPVDFGLSEYDSEEWQRVSGLLTTPFQIANS